MSISDGQIVLQRTSATTVSLDFSNSLSRMGVRAYAPAMQTLCPPMRLRLAQVRAAWSGTTVCHLCSSLRQLSLQAADEDRFGVGLETTEAKGFSGRLQAALQQQPGCPAALCDQVLQQSIPSASPTTHSIVWLMLQVAMLVALLSPRMDVVPPRQVSPLLHTFLSRLRTEHGEVMDNLSRGSPLSVELRSQMEACLAACCQELQCL